MLGITFCEFTNSLYIDSTEEIAHKKMVVMVVVEPYILKILIVPLLDEIGKFSPIWMFHPTSGCQGEYGSPTFIYSDADVPWEHVW